MMSAWVIDRLRKHFHNGMKLDRVPKELHSYYSIHGYLSLILLHPFDITPQTAEKFDNLNCFYDTFVNVPPDIKVREQYLKEYILSSGTWAHNVRTGFWKVNNRGAFLECFLFCIRPDRNIYKYKIEFRARGGVVVHTWKNHFLES